MFLIDIKNNCSYFTIIHHSGHDEVVLVLPVPKFKIFKSCNF